LPAGKCERTSPVLDHNPFEFPTFDGFYVASPQWTVDIGDHRLDMVVDHNHGIAAELGGLFA
jgi:hypothetical protein